MNKKKLVLNITIPIIITFLLWFINFLLLKNLGNIVKIFTNNNYVINYFKNLSQQKLSYPFMFFFVSLIINGLLFFIIKKHNIWFIIGIIILNILFFIAILLFTMIGNQYVFQLIQELKNYM